MCVVTSSFSIYVLHKKQLMHCIGLLDFDPLKLFVIYYTFHKDGVSFKFNFVLSFALCNSDIMSCRFKCYVTESNIKVSIINIELINWLMLL